MTHEMAKKKICFVTTVSLTMKTFVVETAKYLHQQMGWDVTLICSPDADFASSLPAYLHYIPVRMARGIDFSAYQSIFEFVRIFRREKFDVVQYSTPNAACYASIAARIAGVPVRLYAQWGIRYTGMMGVSRLIFRAIEKMVCGLSTHVRSVSPMNRAFGIAEKLYPSDKVSVVGNGGTIGVDLKEYDIGQKTAWGSEIRAEHKIGEDDIVFGFAGRVSADKGCAELLQAFRKVVQTQKCVKLIVVGPLEGDGGIDPELLQWAKSSEQVVFTGKADNQDMKRYYSAMDMLVHPTYREGFGMVIQEAGALAVPVITTKIPGASEVMVDGESCLLVEPKNAAELANAMLLVCSNTEIIARLGQAAYARTEKLYERSVMLENQRRDYEDMLCSR